ncbi:MAG: hypothetical protein JXR37_24085 [Kiritimatiellae bacterium]|nr:hypothetical protein [Kiritimatiellia bacterium]
MSFRIEPQGRSMKVMMYSEKYLGAHGLEMECFENFLEVKMDSGACEWECDGQAAGYTLETSGAKRGKVRLRFSMVAQDDGLLLDTSVENLDDHIIDDIKYNACLKSKHVPFFRDSEGKRVFVWTADGWQSVHALPCRVAGGHWRRMQNYFVTDHEPEGLADGFMGHWGFCPAPLAKAFIARQAENAKLVMGFTWDRAFYCRTNMNDSHHCMHAQGQIDDLCPGETRKRIGKIFFAPDGLDQVYAMAKAFFGWKE